MAISPQRLTIYLYSAHRAVIFAIAQLSCNLKHFTTVFSSHSRNCPKYTSLFTTNGNHLH